MDEKNKHIYDRWEDEDKQAFQLLYWTHFFMGGVVGAGVIVIFFL